MLPDCLSSWYTCDFPEVCASSSMPVGPFVRLQWAWLLHRLSQGLVIWGARTFKKGHWRRRRASGGENGNKRRARAVDDGKDKQEISSLFLSFPSLSSHLFSSTINSNIFKISDWQRLVTRRHWAFLQRKSVFIRSPPFNHLLQMADLASYTFSFRS